MSVFKGGHSTAPREHGTRLDIYPWVRMATKMADRWVQMYSIAIQTQYVYCTFEGKTEPVPSGARMHYERWEQGRSTVIPHTLCMRGHSGYPTLRGEGRGVLPLNMPVGSPVRATPPEIAQYISTMLITFW